MAAALNSARPQLADVWEHCRNVFVFVLFLNSLLHLPLVENDLACLDTRVMLPQPHEQRYPLDDLRKSKGLHSVSAYRH